MKKIRFVDKHGDIILNIFKKLFNSVFNLTPENNSIFSVLSKVAPSFIRVKLRPIKKKCMIIFMRMRTNKRITRLFGPAYKPYHGKIEIDITYSCNLSCPRCNRLCNYPLPAKNMSVTQIEKFVNESISKDRKWRSIHIAGGEPTLHPNLLKICDILISYKTNYSPETRISLLTNGLGEHVSKVLSMLPKEICIVNSHKHSSKQIEHIKYLVAPCDLAENRNMDFSNGCRIPQVCGIGLTPYGYYACNIAGAFDRIIGLDIGKKSLPESDDMMSEHFCSFCKFCGAFGKLSYKEKREKEEEMTQSWKDFLAKYKNNPPELTKY